MKKIFKKESGRQFHRGGFLILLFAVMAVGCGVTSESGIGLRLPEGNMDRGKTAFLELQCHACHAVARLSLPEPASKGPFQVELGGQVLRVRTYGELVTSIINPNHIISDKYRGQFDTTEAISPMPDYNKTMTVEQMIDLVAFLQIHYRLPPVVPVFAE